MAMTAAAMDRGAKMMLALERLKISLGTDMTVVTVVSLTVVAAVTDDRHSSARKARTKQAATRDRRAS